MSTAARPATLADLPLWRLIILLDDAERTLGPSSETARAIAHALQGRMAAEPPIPAPIVLEVGGNG